MPDPVTLTVTIGPRTETFQAFETNAPKAYDHGAVLELYDGTYIEAGRQKIHRVILVPVKDVPWQTGRNHSGLHTLDPETLLDPDQIAAALWQRLYGAKT